MSKANDLITTRALEKSSRALDLLVTARGTIHDRLVSAWRELGMLAGRELPEPFQGEYDEMLATVSTGDIGDGEGIFENSIRALNDDDAQFLARQMITFAKEVAKATVTRS